MVLCILSQLREAYTTNASDSLVFGNAGLLDRVTATRAEAKPEKPPLLNFG